MAPRRFMSEIDFTKTQLAIFFVVLLLSIDEYVLNCSTLGGSSKYLTSILSLHSSSCFILYSSICRINPVKIFLHVFPALSPWHVAGVCILLMSYAFISEMKNLVYLAVKIFFHSILSIFFRDVDIIGRYVICYVTLCFITWINTLNTVSCWTIRDSCQYLTELNQMITLSSAPCYFVLFFQRKYPAIWSSHIYRYVSNDRGRNSKLLCLSMQNSI
jgi:hypothetical protein